MARKFSTTQVASGVLQFPDLIQYGNMGLIYAVDKLKQDKLDESEDKNKTIKSFLSKSITIKILPEIQPGLSKLEFLTKLETAIETSSDELINLEK